MFRVRTQLCTIVVAGFLILASTPLLGQTVDQRLQEAFAEIALLKRIVAEQDRRISELEKTKRLQQASVPPTSNTPAGAVKTQSSGVPPSDGTPWKSGTTWDKVRDGMSQSQVMSILGQPTSIENSVGSFRTLFYRAEVGKSGFVSGNVKLYDDRVYEVNKPVY